MTSFTTVSLLTFTTPVLFLKADYSDLSLSLPDRVKTLNLSIIPLLVYFECFKPGRYNVIMFNVHCVTTGNEGHTGLSDGVVS